VSASTDKKRLKVHVRWMIRRDMGDVLGIEDEAFEFPWSEELHRTRLHVLNFAVSRQHRRLGVGSLLVDKLSGKLTPERRSRILLEVRETNLPAQLFFRSCGFRAISVVKDFYQDTTEDAYLMEYLCPAAEMPQLRRMAG
jgi:ribosomal-protein-alanine N-acetyltransferase